MMADRLVRMIANTTATPSTLLSYLDRIGLYDAIDQTFLVAAQVLWVSCSNTIVKSPAEAL